VDTRHEHEPPNAAGLPEVFRPAVPALPPHAQGPRTPAASLDALGLLKALRRRCVLAVGLGVLLAAAAAGVAYVVVPPAKYTAKAMLRVATETPRILVKTAENESNFATFQRTQLAMMRSRIVLEEALKQPEVAKLPVVREQIDPAEWLDKELQIEFAQGSEILRVTMSHADAKVPSTLVNAVVQAYYDLVVLADEERRGKRALDLKVSWTRYQENLRNKREDLKLASMAAGSDDKQALAILQRSEAERLAEAEAELAQTNSELRALRVEYDIVKRNLAAAGPPSAAAVEAIVAQDAEVRRLADLMDEARARYERVDRIARKGEDPALMRHRGDYQAAKAALAARRKALAPLVAEELSRPEPGDASKLEALRERVEILAGLERLQAGDVERLTSRQKKTTEGSTNQAAIREEIKYAEEMAGKMGAEVEALNIEKAAPARVTRVEDAVVPKTKDELRQAKAAGVAGFGAFGLALFGVAFLEYRTRKVDTVDEVLRSLSIRLVGTLPAMPRTNRRPGVGAEAWQSVMVESVDAARAVLLHAARRDSARMVMIASALGGEGKTSLSCHLAASLTRAGLRTLLVDCDLRRPSIHRLFELPVGPGVCEILRGESDVESAIVPAELAGLAILPAGECDTEAIQALACGELGILFAKLRTAYDFVVVDSSPVLPVADSLQVAQHVDTVLYSVLRDVSRMPALHAAHARLASVGIRPLGVVVAGTGQEFYGNAYYAYAGSQTSKSA